MPRVFYETVYDVLLQILLRHGFDEPRAKRCAQLFADTSRDGIYSHGLNRFPRFIETIERGVVDVDAQPQCVQSAGAIEQWNGRSGPGNLNAYACMERALTLARNHGIGAVALRHTNHWMRGGSYGWQAANADMGCICWTNTCPNLPPWGARECRLGNNPLVIAIPRPDDKHVVLDMAMSQFSYGTLETYRRREEPLPVQGGYDEKGNLTRDAAAIEQSGRPLPVGFWKGSGLSLMLDMMAALLSGGKATHQIPADIYEETDLSQVFIAFNVSALNSDADEIADQIIASVHGAEPTAESERVYYPGERTLKRRQENMENGIPVDADIWDTIRAL